MRTFKRRTMTFAVIFTILGSWVQQASAEPKTISFETLFELALEESPAAREIEAEASRRSAEAISLRTLDNPELSAEIRPFVSGPSDLENEYEVSLSQPLFVSSFGQRSRVARIVDESSRVEAKIARHELRQELLLLYGRAWSLQEYEAVIGRIGDRVAKLRRGVREGEKKGLLPASSTLALRARGEAIGAESLGVSASRRGSIAKLEMKSGARIGGMRLEPPGLPAIEPALLGERAGDLPIMQRAEIAARLAGEQAQLARLDSYPRFVPRIGYEHVSDGGDSVNVGLSIEVPIFDRGAPDRRRARADADLLEAKMLFASRRLPEQAEALYDAVRGSAAQIDAYRTKVIPALEAALNAAEEEISGGQANPQLAIQLLSDLQEAEEKQLALWAEALSRRVELAVLLGRDI